MIRKAHNLRMPGPIVSTESYEAGVARVVERFQRWVNSPNPLRGNTPISVHTVLAALKKIGVPATYSEVVAELDFDETRENRWRVSSRLGLLVKQGQARRVGQGTHQVRGHFGGRRDVVFHPWLYEYAGECPAAVERKARRWLDREMDRLDNGRALRMCVMSSWSFAGSDRNQQIIAEYVRGKTKMAIGHSYGLSRERVRQIIARAINTKRAGAGRDGRNV